MTQKFYLSKKNDILFLLTLLIIISGNLFAQHSENFFDQKNHGAGEEVKLPNGWSLSPAGRSLPLGDLPLNIAVAPSKKLIAVTNNGVSIQSIQLIDPLKEKLLSTLVVPKAWYGLSFSDDANLYASGGNDNWILHFKINKGKLWLYDSIALGKKWPEKISPAGIAIDESKQILYVVTKENNSLYVVDLSSKEIKRQISLGAEAYSCILSQDKKLLYISVWGGAEVLVFDTQKQTIASLIEVGNHPNEIILSKNGKHLFVANANDNSVSVIDVQKKKVIENLNSALYPDAPTGSTPNGLALSSDGKQLLIANADNNCLAVYDVSMPGKSKAKGFIPTGWYPTNVRVVGKKIFVTNGKGFSSIVNPYRPDPTDTNQTVRYHQSDSMIYKQLVYIGGLYQGSLSIIDWPNETQLGAYAKQVYRNTPYSKEKEMWPEGEKGNPIPMKVGDSSPIKYVFYIVKENRTYDQVLGDLSHGNGDKSLVLFGEKITPNQHALANEFVLLDNFYVNGEVSADGHNWSFSANATDCLQKNWPTYYSDRGGTYDAEGLKDIANPTKGFIWDYCKRAGVSYRTYGEFAEDYKANIPVLENHFCPYYASWDQTVRDTARFYQWKREFDSLLERNAVPQLNTLWFINDHTEGLNIGKPTPFAHVADNDFAVGLFVEHLSKSRIWKESVVFIVEDDAQNGTDHVDAHRTTAYVAGSFVKRGYADHTMYATSSMLRTIELILGLPPMSQYDAAATPMWRCFSKESSEKGFTALLPNIDLNEKNTKRTSTALLSSQLDFSKEDRILDLLFSEIIWKAVKGEDAIMPAPRRSAFLKVQDTNDR